MTNTIVYHVGDVRDAMTHIDACTDAQLASQLLTETTLVVTSTMEPDPS